MIPEPMLRQDNHANMLIGSSSEHTHPLMISANDRASKRQKGVGHEELSTTSHTTSSTISSSSSSSVSCSRISQTEALLLAKQQPRNRVSFAPVTAIRSTDWSLEEIEHSWYTKEELSDLKLERKTLVKALKKVNFDRTKLDSRKHPCLRGFEAYFSIQRNKEYKSKRQMVWNSVFQEQARQRYLQLTDSTMMYLVSTHASQWARDTAAEQGMIDAQVALEIFVEYMNEPEYLPQPHHQQQQQHYEQELEPQLVDDDELLDLEPLQVNYDDCEDYDPSNKDFLDSLQTFDKLNNSNSNSNNNKFHLPDSLNCSYQHHHFASGAALDFDQHHHYPHEGQNNVVQQLEVALRLA